MNKFLLCCLAVVPCFLLGANEPEKEAVLESRIVLKNGDGYFILSDRTYWKVITFVKRWRTPSEWWYDAQLLPANYECSAKDWFTGADIEVYPKFGNVTVNEQNASNSNDIKQCTHLLVNAKNGQTLFAISLNPTEFLVQLFAQGTKEGYDDGYTQGRLAGFNNALDSYNGGYADGHQVGFVDGYEAALRNEPPPYQ